MYIRFYIDTVYSINLRFLLAGNTSGSEFVYEFNKQQNNKGYVSFHSCRYRFIIIRGSLNMPQQKDPILSYQSIIY